jgi:aspartate 1-decarboxylase
VPPLVTEAPPRGHPAALHHEGSITIDARLLEAAEIQPPSGAGRHAERSTFRHLYGRGGVRDAGTAAARLVQVGDPVIIITYAQFSPEEARGYRPRIVILNSDNSIRESFLGDAHSVAGLSEAL